MKIMGNGSVRRLVLVAALNTGLGFGTHASAQDDASYLIDLNTKTATSLGNVTANAINDAGQVVGTYNVGGGVSHAFITGPNGVGLTDLSTLGGSYGEATGINAAGQVVGDSYTAGGEDHNFITGPNGLGMTDLGSLGGGEGEPRDINATGQVVGFSFVTDGSSFHAFITGPNGVGMTDLGTLGGGSGDWSTAAGINAAGRVAGWSDTAGGEEHAFITGPNGVGMTDLGTLGGSSSEATGINDAGQVVGDSGGHAFITGPNGESMTDLGTLGGSSIFAAGINDAGQVVGSFDTATGGTHAFITGPNGVDMTDLNSLVHLPGGVVMDSVSALNNVGQVIVHATEYVSSVPEPESYALMLAGLALIGVMVRRKQKD